MAINLDLNLVFLVLCTIVHAVVAIAAIILLAQLGGASFQFVIIYIYLLLACAAMLASDLYKPLMCAELFGFLKYYVARSLLYLLFGALVFQDTVAVTFPKFAGGYTWFMCVLMAVMALAAFADKNQSLPKHIEPLRYGAGASASSKPNTTAMSSNQA